MTILSPIAYKQYKKTLMRNFLGITMKGFLIVVLLFNSLGCKAHSWNDRSMVYGFDNVSLALCQTTSSKVSIFLTIHLD